jgi:hypothetical protein
MYDMGIAADVTAIIVLASVPLQLPPLQWHRHPHCNGVHLYR